MIIGAHIAAIKASQAITETELVRGSGYAHRENSIEMIVVVYQAQCHTGPAVTGERAHIAAGKASQTITKTDSAGMLFTVGKDRIEALITVNES